MLMPAIKSSAAMLIASYAFAAQAATPVISVRPNILLILADDLGYSDLGVFGGEIHTPNLDALAASGRVLSNFHSSATGAPARAMILTGKDHHQVGLGSTAEAMATMILRDRQVQDGSDRLTFSKRPSGYEGYLKSDSPNLPQMLKKAGYHTYMAGKWHLAVEPVQPSAESQGMPFKFEPRSFPKSTGFESSFALLTGGFLHFSLPSGMPAPYIENDAPAQVPADFYSSTFYTDKLLQYIDANKGDGKPFFAYAAYTAPHAPLQAPQEIIAHYKGQYDKGYEVVQLRRLARQRTLGLISAKFSPSVGVNDALGRPRWGQLSDAQRASEARKMEIYAAMVEELDTNIGRLIQHLKEIGEYERTVIVFTSDNGPDGSSPPAPPGVDNSLENLGRVTSATMYGERWAEVSATPFKLWKGYPTEGGLSVPLIVRLPGQQATRAPISDLTHVLDLHPTLLEVAGLSQPASHNTRSEHVYFEGISLLTRLMGKTHMPVRSGSDVLADELYGGRYIIHGDWKLESVQPPFGDGNWALYNIRTDRGESVDRRSSEPGIADRLTKEWDFYASHVGVVSTQFSPDRGPLP